jgi:hypothetical protein
MKVSAQPGETALSLGGESEETEACANSVATFDSDVKEGANGGTRGSPVI